MTFDTDLAWMNIQELEPRVGKLLTAAVAAMARGDLHTHHSDALYSDVKPFLRLLVGGDRGRQHPRARHEPPLAHEAQFAAILTEPYTGTESDDAYLRNQWLFDVACTYIYDRLCTLSAELYGRNAA